MCGILGVINGEKSWTNLQGLNKYMEQGCLTGLFRGEDSTGLLQVSRDWNAKVFKATVDGYYFRQHKRVQELLRNVDSNPLTLIHHRAATHGSVSYNNCHPFEHEMPNERYVVGVHNGTVHSFERTEDGLHFSVDSDWLYYRIAKLGAAKALGALNSGAYALVWFEKPNNKVYIAANKERPIHWAAVKGKNALLIASESEMLYWLAHRNGMEIEQVYYPAVDKVWEFDPTGDLRAPVATDLIKPPKSKATHSAVESRQATSHYSNRRETGDVLIVDKYGPDALKATAFTHMEEVSFVMKRSVPIETNRADAVAVFGEAISDTTTAVQDAVIPNTNTATVENLEKSYDVICKVIGSREITNKTTGVVTTLLLLAPPHKTFLTEAKKEEVVELDDLPFGTTGSNDTLIPQIRGPLGKNISATDFLNLVKYGCSCCSQDISIRDADDLGWVNGSNPICKDCVSSFEELNQ